MRIVLFIWLCCISAIAQNVLITNACCDSLSRIDFSLQGTSGVFSVPYGAVSTTINATAGTVILTAKAGGDLNYTSQPFTLTGGQSYFAALYGNLATAKLVGPLQSKLDGDRSKIRMRFGLLATYFDPTASIHLRVLCPSFGNTPVFDQQGALGAVVPTTALGYWENGSRKFQEMCRLQLVNTASGTVLDQSFPLSTGNNYTVVAVGTSQTPVTLVILTDNR